MQEAMASSPDTTKIINAHMYINIVLKNVLELKVKVVAEHNVLCICRALGYTNIVMTQHTKTLKRYKDK